MAAHTDEGEFEITVHAKERIVEVRYPARPTKASVERYAREVRAVISKLGGKWKCLVDQAAVSVIPQELTPIISELNTWALEHGMQNTARVVKNSAISELQVRRIMREGGISENANVYASRAEAWDALNGPDGRATPGTPR